MRKISSSWPILLADSLKTTSVSFFIADLNLLSFEFNSFTFKLLYCVIFILTKIKNILCIQFNNLIISLTNSNFSSIFMLLYHFLLVNQKSFFHQSIHCNLLFLHLEYKIFYYLFFAHHLQMLKQKVYLHLESLVQLNNLSLHFVLIILVLLDIYSNLFFF